LRSLISGCAFIVSNGRCGSTLLSDLIARQDGVLSVQEFGFPFFGFQYSDVELGKPLTGANYWDILSCPSPNNELARIGAIPVEFRYPEKGRWAGRLTELPAILGITLPAVSPDPDDLFDELAVRVPEFPVQDVAGHHLMFFDLLTWLAGRRRWVERSGGSSLYASYLLREYPLAKFIHLTRDLASNARSMSRHPAFRLTELRLEFAVKCGIDPYQTLPSAQGGADHGPRIPEELREYLPGRLTREKLEERATDENRFRKMCALMSSIAEQAFADLPPKELLKVRYEDLIADPFGELSRIGRFLEFDDWQGWAELSAREVVDPHRG
jgi:putative sulfotransferase